MSQHFNASKLKKASNLKLKAKQSQINKRSVLALVFLEYHIFMQSLLKEISAEARDKRSKVIRQEHVKAVGKKVVKKFKA